MKTNILVILFIIFSNSLYSQSDTYSITHYYGDGKLKDLTDLSTGEYQSYFENSQLKKIGFYDISGSVLSKSIGVWKEYDRHGELIKVINYSIEKDKKNNLIYDSKGQLLSGEWKEYYDNGNLKLSGTFNTYKKNGEWRYYYENSQLKKTGNFNDDKKIEEWQYYYENGYKKMIGAFLNNERNGKWLRYGKRNGKLQVEIEYRNGIRNGKFKVFNSNGDVIKEFEYVNGIKTN
ncbi:MAG: hypothetical protein JEZ01_12365 [Labilibaculum sp.]|nr:hypothetical protein [Labilibaculum sp.]MBI9058549.1 hypothetical protein [Labilibaculum sp.]